MFRTIKKFLQKIHNFLTKEEDILKEKEHLLASSVKRTKKEFCHYIFRKWFIPHSGNDHTPTITHHHTLGTFVLVIFIFKLIVLGVLVPKDHSYAGGVSSNELVFMTNQARANEHLAQLKVSDELVRAARFKAEHMFENGYWSHNSPDGLPPWHWFDQVGYNYEHAGENLAMDFYSSDGVFDGWENSRKHWENIINPNFREIGIAVVPGVFKGKNTTIVVQLFGTRPGSKVPPTRLVDSSEAEDVMENLEKRELNRPEIISPESESYSKNTKPLIMGKADSQVLVTVLDDKFNLGQVPSDDYGYYSYRVPELYDGKHVFKSYSSDGPLKSEYSDPVMIHIDTQAPILTLDNLEIEYSKIDLADVFKLKIAVTEDIFSLQAVYKNRKIDFILSDSGFFKGVIRFEEKEKRSEYPITLYATDQAKNSAVLDLKLTPVETGDPKVLGVKNESNENNEGNEENEGNERNEDDFVISSAPLNQTKGIGSGQAEKSKLKDGDLSATVPPEADQPIAEKTELKNEEAEGSVMRSELIKSEDPNLTQEKVMSPHDEKVLSEEISVFAKYGKIVTLAFGLLLFLAYLLQAYVIYHKGLQDGKSHPIFHAIGVLCIMVLILMN